MATNHDTEITLGTGKMLALFFSLVVLCAVFFGMGFTMGRNSVKTFAADVPASAVAANAPRPSAVKANSATAPADLTFYKTVEQKDSDVAAKPAVTNAVAASEAPVTEEKPTPPDPMVAMPTSGYFVQVAAVSKQEDAEALVEALKKHQYAALIVNGPSDKLFHVQVGPFSDIKDAESMRGKLVSDGYNPILKK